MKFKTIQPLPEFQLQPTALTKLAPEIGTNHKFSPPELPPEVNQYQTRPPRSLDDIFMDLEQRNAENISLLEWVYCIYYKKDWDQKHSKDQQLSTSRLIWEGAIDNDAIKQRLCWRLAYYYDGHRNRNSLAPSLVETFSTLSDIHGNDLAVKILCTLQKRDPVLPIAKLSLRKELTPKDLFKTAQLPTNLSIINDALEYVVTAFSEHLNPTRKEASWLLNCFEIMTVEQEISAVETLLKKVSAEVGGQFNNLVQWLQNNYSPRATASQWSRLSTEAKSTLRQWFGAANYRDFQKLVEIILKRLPLQDWEKNQLDSRKYFWEQYSDRFERIRILLPQSSVNVVGNQIQQDIDVIKHDRSEETEVCIFDFGNWFVVEFFRGSGSETRIFKRDQYPNLEQKLFESSQLSVKRLRAFGGEVHDHKYLWQIDCEKWLRERGILPNPGTTYFKRRNRDDPNRPHHDPYNPKTGLPLRDPYGDKRRKRERDLMRWRREIEQLEREARSAFDFN
ncbi:MAG: EH signature domain-containing protein [Halothece sp. Uz-M2-17]|nr:EH signature domain-containing protein [Halothece sp. Uz-M2-17]